MTDAKMGCSENFAVNEIIWSRTGLHKIVRTPYIFCRQLHVDVIAASPFTRSLHGTEVRRIPVGSIAKTID